MMKIRLPFLWPMLWKSASPKPTTTTSSSTLAAIPAHQQHYPPKISSRAKRRLSTAPFSSTEPELALPQPAYIRAAGTSTLAHSPNHGIHCISGAENRTAQLYPYRAPSETAGFRTSVRRRRPDTSTQRYGVANEPPPQFAAQRLLPPKQDPRQSSSRPALPKPTTEDVAQAQASSSSSSNEHNPPIDVEGRQVNPVGDEPLSTASIVPPLGPTTGRTPDSAPAQVPGTIPLTSAEAKSTPSAQNQNALGLILGMEPAEKPPHLQAPPYVHHFDTYTLVRDLEKGGFTEDQAITMMKAVRGILADNVELANSGILSKGDSEMATYLFRAACHELRTEIRSNRHSTSERMRAERATTQHEVDILSQKVTQEIGTLKDNLKGMFDDRKMAVRIERRDVENKIQELNYRITTRLTSEMRSEVELLRWVLVRRVAMALGAVVVTALVSIRTSTYRAAQAKEEEKRARELGRGGGGPGVGGEVLAGVVSGGIVGGMQAGDDVNPELVSLG